MEKRLILAVILMIATVYIVNLMFPPPPPPPPPAETPVEVTPGAVPAEVTDVVGEGAETAGRRRPAVLEPSSLPAVNAGVEQATEDTVWVEGPLYRIAFAQRGARVVSAQMLGFESLAQDTRGQPVELVPPYAEDFFTHKWLVGDDTLDLSGVPFEISPPRGLRLAAGGPPQTLRLTYRPASVPFSLELEYTFRPDEYVFDLVGRVRRLDGGRTSGWWAIGLGPGLQSNEWDPEADYKANLTFSGKGPDGVQAQKITGVESGERIILNGPFDWVAVWTKYFVTALVRPAQAGEEGQFAGLMVTGLPDPYRAEGFASFPVQQGGEFHYSVYMGPQDYKRLSAAGHQLEQVKPYGYKWLQPVLRPLAGAITTLLTWMHNALGLGYGWILVLFGVGIRVVLFPGRR